MYCTYWYIVWPHWQIGSAKRTKIDVLISGMALCHTVLQQLSATAPVRGHLEVWVSLPLCTWKATKKSNSLLWIHLTAVLIPGGKFSRVCSQEDAVSEPRLARESIAVAGQHIEAWEPAETSLWSDLGWPHFPTPPSEAALQAELLCCCSMSEAGEENPCEHSVVVPSCPKYSHPLLPYRCCADSATSPVARWKQPSQSKHGLQQEAVHQCRAQALWNLSLCGSSSRALTYQNQFDEWRAPPPPLTTTFILALIIFVCQT